MDRNRILAIIVVGLMVVLAALVSWANLSSRPCAYAAVLDAKASGACFEFWLNRYQTLLGGIATLTGAVIAAGYVARQTKVAREQLNVMLGDIPPDFLLTSRNRLSGGVKLTILNQNRRPMEIVSIAMKRPTKDMDFALDFNEQLTRRRISGDRKWLVKGVIEGTRPAAPEVKSIVLTGTIWALGADSAQLVGHPISEVVIEIGYRFVGGDQRIKTCSAATDHARIDGASWGADDGAEAEI